MADVTGSIGRKSTTTAARHLSRVFRELQCGRPRIRETSIFVQRIDQGTVNLAPSRAASAHQTRKLVAKRGEIFEAVFDHGELALGEPAGRGTAAAVVELKERGHLIQGEAESLRFIRRAPRLGVTPAEVGAPPAL